MLLEDALPLLRAGFKIRRRSWLKGIFYFKKDKKIFLHMSDDDISCIDDEFSPLDSGDLLASNWEVYEAKT